MKGLMKTFVTILLTALLAISCADRSKRYAETLERADAVVEAHPDSALALLATIDDTAHLGGERNEAMYYLLLNQAQYKLYQPTPTVSHLDQSIAYFKKTNDKHNLCRALCYKGAIIYENGEKEEALATLKEGERLALAIKDSVFIPRYYGNLQLIFANSRNYRLALHYSRLTLQEYEKQRSYRDVVIGYSNIYAIYGKIDQKDSARIYLHKAIPLLDKVKDEDKPYILNNIGSMYSQDGDYENAYHYLQEALKYEPLSETYSILSDVYMAQGKKEDALCALEKACNASNPAVKRSVMKKMSAYFKSCGDLTKAVFYSEWANRLSDTVRMHAKSEKLLEINYKNDIAKEQQDKTSKSLWINILATLFIVSVLSIAIVIWRKQREINKRNKLIEERKNDLSRKQLEINAITNDKHDLENELFRLSMHIAHEVENKKKYKKTVIENLGLGQIYYEKIMNGEPLPINDKDARAHLAEYIVVKLEKQYNSWVKKYGNLSHNDTVYLMLDGLGYPTKKIAAIMCVSEGAIRTIRYRLNNRKQGV